MKFYEIPPGLDSEIDDLEQLIAKRGAGQISETELKVHRVPFGVYEQRASGSYMIRVRCAAGGVTPIQLRRVAELAKQFGDGIVHITTRQEVQIHAVTLDRIIPVIRSLRQVELSTRGGGGNTVRNIIVSPDSGIAPNEAFDVTPYAAALTSRLTAQTESWKLPRKYKIAFGNSEPDNIQARFNDVGFLACIEKGRKGFRVTVAGGMGAKPRVGSLLHDFIPAEEAYIVALAIRNVFSAHGNRRNRHAARLRFLWNTLGESEFVRLYEEEKRRISTDPSAFLKVPDWATPAADKANFTPPPRSVGFETWRNRYVREQKRAGLFSVLIPVSLGILESDRLLGFSEFLQSLGEDVLRFTVDQNILLRNVPEQALGHVHSQSGALSSLTDQPALFGKWIACTGADTCRLGVCLPRGLMKALQSRLVASGTDLDSFADLKMNFSGCPNTCGQHMAADIGFFGKVARKGEDILPAYTLVAGAIRSGDRARLARPIGDVPARAIPAIVEAFLRSYPKWNPEAMVFQQWFDKDGSAKLQDLCARYQAVPSFEEDKNYYYDWGAKDVFSLKGKGAGECSAGLFDLIELDLESAKKARKALAESDHQSGEAIGQIRCNMVLSASRALLITKGIETRTQADAFAAFLEHFISSGLIDSRFAPVIEAARDFNESKLQELSESANDLVDAVERLYMTMDDSLQFPAIRAVKPQTQDAAKQPNESVEGKTVDLERDLRGVACPMNFVKTKLELAKLQSGQLLRVLLDDGAPIENVPRSVEGEGHRIISITREGPHWTVTIRKQVTA